MRVDAPLTAHAARPLVADWWCPRPGWRARLLQPLSWLYRLLAAAHRSAYRNGWLRVTTAPRPLVVVGNLVVGGAGKTPAVLAIVQLLQRQGHRPGVISRGHGRSARQAVVLVRSDSDAAAVGDEPLLIHRRSGAPVCVAADRAAAAARLCQAHPELDVLVADDGLQHHALARALDVIVIDAAGAGNGLLLPAGPLRQAVPERLPPRTVVLYNAERPSTHLPGYLGRRELAGAMPLEAWWRGEPSTRAVLHALRGSPLLAAAGLARPEGFFTMLEAAGLQIERLPLPDHHTFSTLPWPAATRRVIVTEKDAVKLRPGRTGDAQVWVATLDFVPEPAFGTELLRRLELPAPPP